MALVVALGVSGAISSSASGATVTIGQIDPFATPYTECRHGPNDYVQPTVTEGPSYVVPPGGAKITSWITNPGTTGAGGGQVMEMKIFRLVSDVGPTYKVIGHDEHLLTLGLNTVSTNIPVMPGDVLGLNDVNASPGAPEACDFGAPGDRYLQAFGDISDGDQGVFSSPQTNYRLNIQAVVQLAPGASPSGASAFSFGKVKDNKNQGTATITVDVPGPGTVDLAGTGVKPQRVSRTSGAQASKAVHAAGAVKLLVKPKGKAKHKLSKKGKAKVKVSVTYTPSGGNPATQSERVKLIKKP